jgi:hypothetical protein
MKQFDITLDVVVPEGHVYAPSITNWGQAPGVIGYKLRGFAAHEGHITVSLMLNANDDFNPFTTDWSAITRFLTKPQGTVSVREMPPAATQTIAPQGTDGAAFGKIGG